MLLIDMLCVNNFMCILMLIHLNPSTFLQPGGDPHVLCFVDFDSPAQATIALEALQGEHTYVLL
jgi:hypothetical protein